MLNRWEGIGRLGRDVEMRHLPDGTAVASFSVACDEKWKDRSGEEQKRTEWVKCVAFDKLAQICGEYLAKGLLVFVSGKLSTREYEKGGEKKYVTEIRLAEMKMLSGNSGQERSHDNRGGRSAQGGDRSTHGGGATRAGTTSRASSGAATGRDSTEEWEDDVPF